MNETDKIIISAMRERLYEIMKKTDRSEIIQGMLRDRIKEQEEFNIAVLEQVKHLEMDLEELEENSNGK